MSSPLGYLCLLNTYFYEMSAKAVGEAGQETERAGWAREAVSGHIVL